jgi:hypothetical protein
MALSDVRLTPGEIQHLAHWLDHIQRCRHCTAPGGRQANLRLCSPASHMTVKLANIFADHLKPPTPAQPTAEQLW